MPDVVEHLEVIQNLPFRGGEVRLHVDFPQRAQRLLVAAAYDRVAGTNG